MARELLQIEIDRIFLYEENPRHEPMTSEDEVIQYLCKDEQVFNLARSISEAGTNPLVLMGVVQIAGSGRQSTKRTYQVWEGNRRLCALKLLNDPDRAPPDLRKDFARLSGNSSHVPFRKIPCVVFDDHDDLRFWMGIIHDGTQGGVGLLSWDADQKARHFGSNRNKVALAVLDAAEVMGLITKEDRAGKLYTSAYDPEDHAKVSERILQLQHPWITTYDDCDEVQKLYTARRQYQISLNYSAQVKRVGSELLIASKGLRLPAELREAQVHRVQYRSATTDAGIPA